MPVGYALESYFVAIILYFLLTNSVNSLLVSLFQFVRRHLCLIRLRLRLQGLPLLIFTLGRPTKFDTSLGKSTSLLSQLPFRASLQYGIVSCHAETTHHIVVGDYWSGRDCGNGQATAASGSVHFGCRCRGGIVGGEFVDYVVSDEEYCIGRTTVCRCLFASLNEKIKSLVSL